MSKVIDLTGQTFGRLTVLCRVENDKYGRSKWLCKCDCGNKKIIPGAVLRKSESSSCGCYKLENTRKRTLKPLKTGDRFGKLTVISYSHSAHGTTYYNCKCDCGNIKNVQKNALTSGKTKSCGCSKLITNFNRGLQSNNTSGYTGVSYVKRDGKYSAYIRVNKKNYSLGYWDTAIQAYEIRCIAEEKLVLPLQQKYYDMPKSELLDSEIKKGIESIKDYYKKGGRHD